MELVTVRKYAPFPANVLKKNGEEGCANDVILIPHAVVAFHH